MFGLIAKALFFCVFATIFACAEIELEGKYGWAHKVPTWFRTTGYAGKIYGKLMGGKPLTGYHLFMFFVPVLIFHSHFFMGVEWSGIRELEAWAMYFAWCVMWDYHWFVLNPYYRRMFKRDCVWWHSKSHWVGGLFPIDYAISILLSLVFASATWLVSDEPTMFIRHNLTLISFSIYTGALFLAAPKYHRWYFRMREHDDRDKVRIFYDDEP